MIPSPHYLPGVKGVVAQMSGGSALKDIIRLREQSRFQDEHHASEGVCGQSVCRQMIAGVVAFTHRPV
ncbi:hypothetical protein HYPDE_22993 [Hyphomicrobium denitrificans 1NES1]|uniref:Uncharacterized protein n=1 Tax=Hyphomicrobium denitrificans 1NES1 TaxID=670307 RepID=N0B899_9HYPH|nr:hypothetical protein HYPDE_22993 [Hyphomicrobium denitrificans 1NES1]